MRVFALVVVLLTARAASGISVTGIREDRRQGSAGGAAAITVEGTGFVDSSFSASGTSSNKGIEIFLVSASGTREYECPIDDVATTRSNLICYTEPMPEGYYYLKITTNGIQVPDDNMCGGQPRGSSCTFQVSSSKTPVLERVTPWSSHPSQELRLTGKIFTERTDAATSLSSNGNEAIISRVYVGGKSCNLRKEVDTLYGVALTSENGGYINCLNEGKDVGCLNVSFIIDEDYGRSIPDARALAVRGDYRLCSFQGFAAVDSVHPTTGSNNGGTTITVNGNFFKDDGHVEVSVGGSPCEIVELEDPSLTCITPPMVSDFDIYPGSRGIRVELFPGVSDVSSIEDVDYEDVDNDDKSFHEFEELNFDLESPTSPSVIRVRGFFRPAKSGTFTISTSIEANIFLSTDHKKANKVSMAENGVLLEGQKLYYFEITRSESSTSISMKIKAYLRETDYTNAQTFMSIDEVQRFWADSPDEPEIQTLTLSNWESPPNGEQEEIDLCLKCLVEDDCESGEFGYSFSLYGLRSGELLYSSTAPEIQTVINDMAMLLDDTVLVEAILEDIGDCHMLYRITVQSIRGSIPFEVVVLSPDNIQVTTSVFTDPVQDMSSFTVAYDGIPTGHVQIGDTNGLRLAVMKIFGTECPRSLEGSIGSPSLYIDFESGAYSTRDAYCGVHSMRNSGYLFQSNEEVPVISLATDTQLCFAYKGPVTASITVRYSYIYYDDENEEQRKNSANSYFHIPVAEDWIHICTEITSLIKEQSTVVGMYDFELISLQFNVQPSDDGSFIDNVFVGTMDRTDNELELLRGNRRLPLDDNRLYSVVVEKNAEDTIYTVKMNPIDCGFDLPQIKIAHATEGPDGTFKFSTNAEIAVEQTQAASLPMGGTFALTLTGEGNGENYGGTLESIAWDATDETVESAIQSLDGINDVRVTRSGWCRGYSWTVTFVNPAGRHGVFQVDKTDLTNALAEMYTEIQQLGGLYLDPIPGDWVRVAHSKPQIEVSVRNTPSLCTGDCNFEWSDAQTPSINNAQLEEVGGEHVATITGSNFNEDGVGNTVTIGGVTCTVTESDGTSAKCTMAESPGGMQPLILTATGKGATNAFDVNVPFEISDFTPKTGSDQGGTVLTITGTGFTSGVVVEVGDATCTITGEIEYNELKCITGPALSGDKLVTVAEGLLRHTFDTACVFSTPATEVTDISPTQFSLKGGPITITGTGFGDSSTEKSVYLGDNKLEVKSWTDTEILATAPPLAPDGYTLRIDMQPIGNAKITPPSLIHYILTVNTVTPATSSLMGGRTLQITGQGFYEDVEVMVGTNPCEIDVSESSETSITCHMGSCGETHIVRNTGPWAHGIGYSWEPKNLKIAAGEAIRWVWEPQFTASGASYQIYTTKGPGSVDYDNDGFHSGDQTDTGSFLYTFTTPGVYYVGGWATPTRSIFMRGVITVLEPADVSKTVSVKASGFEASYDIADGISVQCSVAETPTITSISPSQGHSHDLITIEGTGFSAAAGGTTVTIGGKSCTVEGTTTDTSVACKVAVDTELPVAINYEVEVQVVDKGSSKTDIRLLLSRYFALTPHISSVSPVAGSLGGSTRVTLMGGGLTKTSTVRIGGVPCIIDQDTLSYTSLACVTGPSENWSGSVSVQVSDVPTEAKCVGTCDFAYSTAATPTLTGVTPTEVRGSTQLTISGTGFGTDQGNINALFGSGIPCVVDTIADDTITCTVSDVPAGDHELSLIVVGKGKAVPVDTLIVRSIPEVTDMSPAQGSINGGTEVTIQGNGFVEGSTSVVIASSGAECKILSVHPNVIKFETPVSDSETQEQIKVISNNEDYPLQDFDYTDAATPTVTTIDPQKGKNGATITLTGTKLEGNPEVLIGDVPCVVTAATDTSISCTLGARFGGSASTSVKIAALGYATIEFIDRFSYTFDITSITPNTGSLGGGQEVTIAGDGFDAVSTVTICDNLCEVIGDVEATSLRCITPIVDAAGICDVVVKNHDEEGGSVTLISSYTYDVDLTMIITSVDPPTGGTGGGTLLTVEGSNLQGVTEVNIDGSICDIEGIPTATSFQCRTNEHQGTIKTTLAAKYDGHGIATVTEDHFEYIDRWSSVFTWGGISVPQNGEFVSIEEGQTVLMDTTTNKLKMLLIEGGKVIFEDGASEDVHLHAENILITKGGLLQIGTEQEPYMGEAQITMHGHLRSQELPIYGAKTLGVRGGTLDLHGKPVPVPWTVLAETAEAASTQLKLQVPVDWIVGGQIVIATTGMRHSQSQTEVNEITSVSDDGKTLTLKEPLEYRHLGTVETYTLDDGEQVEFEYRAEVGLLTRNIKFQGSNVITWNVKIDACPDGFDTGMHTTQTCFQGRFGEEIGSDQFGASIMMHAETPTTDPDNSLLTARIENVELNYVGQAFRLGRYPIHWHLMGDMSNSYVKRCAIHKSFNRAVTIHGVHNLLVEHNIAYNIMGGTFFIEDGIETGNIIQYNLAVFIKASSSLLNDDITPAAYWVTNPQNIIRHNHAAGGTHFGFWYRMHKHPDGPSYTPEICQQHAELGQFENNTAHSMGWYGLWIFKTYLPRKGDSCSSTTPIAAKFNTLIAWNNEKGAEPVITGAIQFISFKLANNEVSGIDIKSISGGIPYDPDQGARIVDATIICSAYFGGASGIGISLPMSRGLYTQGAKFLECKRATFMITSISGTCTKNCGGFQAFFEGLKFGNSPYRFNWLWHHEVVIVDLDGSLGQTVPGKKYLPWDEHIGDENDPNGKCIKSTDPKFSAEGGIPTAICDLDVSFHRLALNNPSPSTLHHRNFTCKNDFGTTYSPYERKRLTHKPGWMLLLRSKMTYTCEFEGADHISNMSYDAAFYDFGAGDYIIMRHNVNQKPDKVMTYIGDPRRVEDTSPLTLDSKNLDWHYDIEETFLEYMIKKDNAQDSDPINWGILSISPRMYRCFYRDCLEPLVSAVTPAARAVPDDAVTVTSATDEDACFEYEGDSAEGTDVTIPEGCWIVWAIPKIKINKLWVVGSMSFKRELDLIELSATHIIVQGSLYAGWDSEDPHPRSINIKLRGNHTSEELAASGDLILGAKSVSCVGRCEIHGVQPEIVQTNLEETATIGTTTLKVKDSVDWTTGQQLVIAPSGFNPATSETAVIASVSGDGKTITITEPLQYEHTAKPLTDYGQGYVIEMLPEVALLTRKIRIEGEDYDEDDDGENDMIKDGFGCRVVVGSSGSSKATGSFTGVEFYHCGQLGYTDAKDPRIQLAYKNAAPSTVHKCSFNKGFSPAVGFYSTSTSTASDNVAYSTIDGAYIDQGARNRLLRNLAIFDSPSLSYKGRFIKSWKYNGAFEIDRAQDSTLTNNTVAGAHRAAYQVSGQPCTDNPVALWTGNKAHSSLVGIFQMSASSGSCTVLNDFLLYKIWDYAIYHQSSASHKVTNCVILDSSVAYAPIVFGPSSLSHGMQEKSAEVQSSLFVGRTDCIEDADENDPSLVIRRTAGASKKAIRNQHGGMIAIILPMFQSGHNGATFKSLLGNKNYPALKGILRVNGVRFAKYNNNCGRLDSIFFTSGENEDIIHPTQLSDISMQDVTEEAKLFFLNPSLSKVNPSDCVDMTCDAKKEVMIKDLDGSFLGQKGSVIPDSAYQWDDNPRYGLGDYRVPFVMRSNATGHRMDVDELATKRGHLMNDACTWISDWNAFKCIGDDAFDYKMIILESLDGDSESRRLSPVGILCEDTIDLVNGPQDHGWCAGYTCQKRLSTFWFLVPNHKEITIYLTSTPPKNFRFIMLNPNPGDKILIKIWFPTPLQLEGFTAQDLLVTPKNSEPSETGKVLLVKPDPPEKYLPGFDDANGANAFDFDTKYFHVVLGADDVDAFVTVRARDSIIINFGFPPMSSDEFFAENLAENLAIMLGIDPANIRRVNVVRETSRRKKREASTTMSFEVSTEEPNTVVTKVSDSFQQQKLANALSVADTEITSLSTSSILDVEKVAELDQAMRNGEYVEGTTVYTVPTRISLITSPTGEELSVLTTGATIHIMDDTNTLCVTSDTWTVTVSLDKSLSGSDSSATLSSASGSLVLTFVKGKAEFSDLTVSHSGTYKLIFTPTDSAAHLPVISSEEIVITERVVEVSFIKLTPELPKEGEDLLFELQLVDKDSNALTDISHKGLTWKVEVSFDDPSQYTAILPETNAFTFDETTGKLTTTGLKLNDTQDYKLYNLKFRLYTEPASSYDKTVGVRSVQIYPTDPENYIHNGEIIMQLGFYFTNNYDDVLVQFERIALEAGAYNDLAMTYTTIFFTMFEASKTSGDRSKRSATTSDGKLKLTTIARAATQGQMDQFLEAFIKEGKIRLGSTDLTLESSCGITTDGSCYGEEATTQVITNTTTVASPVSGDDTQTSIIVFSTLGACVVLAAVIIMTTCYVKRQNSMAKVSAMRCMDARSGSPESQAPLSYSMDNFQPGVEMDWARATPDSQIYEGITPVVPP